MVHWIEIIYLLILLQALGRCLYYWQLKEYRLDRFREVGWRRYCLPSRRWLFPRLTVKIFLLYYLSVYLSVSLINILPWQWAGPVLAYGLAPVTAAASVGWLTPLSNSLKIFFVLAAKLKLRLGHRRLLVIGVTGSYGKTSTKEILAHILSARFKVAKTRGTENTLMGVAKTVLFNLPCRSQVLVAEMGAYQIGEIASICRLVRPRIGILTGINQQHLALFGSQENIIKAKSELLQALPKNGLAVINGVNPLTKKLTAPAPVKYYRPGKLKTNLLGNHQQLNISAAVTAARYLGINHFRLNDIPVFKTAITKCRGVNGATVINDSYNSNPDGFLAAVTLAKTTPAAKKILISPGIIELGKETEAVHRRLAAAAKKVFDQVLIGKKEAFLLKQLSTTLTKNHLLLIEGRFSPKFIHRLCLNQS